MKDSAIGYGLQLGLCLFLLLCCQALDSVHSTDNVLVKRSDGLLRDLFSIMVDEKVERNRLREEVRTVKKVLEKSEMDSKSANKKLREEVRTVKKVLEKSEMDSKSANKKLKKELKDLKDRYHELQLNSSKYKADAKVERNHLRDEVRDVKKALKKSDKDITRLEMKLKHTNKAVSVAFTARLKTNLQFATNAVIRFGHIITNVGNGYNTSDGIFYCPVAGVYVFDVSLTGSTIYYVDANLYKNNDFIGHIWESMYNINQYPNAAASFTVSLKAGDKVSLKCPHSSRKYYTYSYFTGFLIASD